VSIDEGVVRADAQAAPVQEEIMGLADSALSALPEILRQCESRKLAVFLDYDGTLTPIVARPELAVLADDMRETLHRLAQCCTVAIVSGRALADVQRLVGLDSVIYAGSHGFEIHDPKGGNLHHEEGGEFVPLIAKAADTLKTRLAGVEGVIVEPKTYALAVHYRLVADSDVPRVEAEVDAVVAAEPRLRKTGGKKVFEVRPAMDWHKGRALDWLLEALDLDRPEVLPVYVGDDETDEDAFRVLVGRGLGFIVADGPVSSAASYRLNDTDEVKIFLERLEQHGKGGAIMTEWSLIYTGFDPENERLREAMCTLGNGRFASRGAGEEAEAGPHHYPGTYIAGCYNRLETEIAGRVVENEDLVNTPNWLSLTFRFGTGPWFDLQAVTIVSYVQELDLKNGELKREIRFENPEGRLTTMKTRRLISMADAFVAAREITLIPENWSGSATFLSALDGRVINEGVDRYKALDGRHLRPVTTGGDGDLMHLMVETTQAGMRIALAARSRLYRDGQPEDCDPVLVEEPGYVAHVVTADMVEGVPVSLENLVVLHTSRDNGISECGLVARQSAGRLTSFDAIREPHVEAWRYLWDQFDIRIEDDASVGLVRAQLILRLHVFHLLQTASPNTVDLDVSVPARGLTGEAYRGHVFWDELFIFPILNLRMPELTRSLLMYRYRRLGEARAAAAAIGARGAMYPWQSGSDGREETQVIHLNPKSGHWLPDNSRLQRHVNAAVAYNIWQYFQVSDDKEFLAFYGAEMLFEIARFWASIAVFDRDTGRYEIRGVMGPDEYHDGYPGSDEPGLDNNAYTNLMATWILKHALELQQILSADQLRKLRGKLGLTDEELAHWNEVSRKLKVSFHDGGIISQFDRYDDLEEFDWEGYTRKYGDIQRLDRILESENDTPNRYKASKQADVLMLFYLFSSDQLSDLFERLGYDFDHDLIRRNIDYYDRRTSHGSTLSRIVHSWVIARADRAASWNLFAMALECDIGDIQGGISAEGIHLGAMAGTVDLVQRCFAGITMRADALYLDPCLPHSIRRLTVPIRYRGHAIELDITHERLRVHALRCEGDAVTVRVDGRSHALTSGETVEFTLPLEELAVAAQ